VGTGTLEKQYTLVKVKEGQEFKNEVLNQRKNRYPPGKRFWYGEDPYPQ